MRRFGPALDTGITITFKNHIFPHQQRDRGRVHDPDRDNDPDHNNDPDHDPDHDHDIDHDPDHIFTSE